MIQYIFEVTVIPLLGILGFVIGNSARAGYMMAREWHADGAQLKTLAQFVSPWATIPVPRLSFGWAIKLGWKFYLWFARLRQK